MLMRKKPAASAKESTTSSEKAKAEAQRKLEAQRQEFEKNIADLDTKLNALASVSKDTEEYINTLDTENRLCKSAAYRAGQPDSGFS